jgi:hypothetical protein
MVPFLYAIFSVVACLAGVVGIVGSIVTLSTAPLSKVSRAMDALAAAQLSIFFPSWTGRNTVSHECGNTDCRFCKFLCAVLDLMEKDHCKKAAG